MITNLSWFQPCLFVTSIVCLYFYYKNTKLFFEKGLIYTLIGSLLFGNSILIRISSFILIYIFLSTINKKYHFNIRTMIISLIIALLIHFYSSYLILLVSRKITFSFLSVIWQFIHTILLNVSLCLIFYYFFGIKRKLN